MRRSYRFIFSFFLAILLSVGFCFPVFAVEISIDSIPSSVTEAPFMVGVSLKGATSATNYLRVEIFKEGSTQYFGYTKNTDTWYNGTDGKQYRQITVADSGSWSGEVEAKIDTADSGFKGPGNYLVRIKRYTASGNAASSDTVKTATIALVVPSFTPTPLPTAIPTPTTKATPTIKPSTVNKPTPTTPSPSKSTIPSPSQTPHPTLTKQPTGKLLSSPSPSSLVLAAETTAGSSEAQQELSEKHETSISQLPTPLVQGVSSTNPPSLLFVAIGFFLVIFGIITYLWKAKKNKQKLD